MSGLEVRVIHKSYPGSRVAILKDLNFTADSGEFVAIVGPSGAGKSTLLNIISGLDRDLQGEVRYQDRLLHVNNAQPARIGFIFQDPRLMPWLTVLENLRLVLKAENSIEVARHALRDVELVDVENAFPGQLSGGMQRRVAMARAFIMQPALLLMDEPFVSLDAPTAARLHTLLLKLWRESRATVLFVTHNLREALSLADRVLFLSGSPAGVVLDMPIDIPRPRHLDDSAVSALHDSIIREHPEILSGHAGVQAVNSSTHGEIHV